MNIDQLHHLDMVRKVALALPEVEEYFCYGTPAFRVKRKLLARMKEDGATLAVHCQEREKWMQFDPVLFFITYHYRNSAMVLVNLPKITEAGLHELLKEAWKAIAPKTLVKKYLG